MAHVGRQPLGDLCDAVRVQGVADRDGDAHRQALDGLERLSAVGCRAGLGAVDLVAQRIVPQLVHAGQHDGRALAQQADAARDVVDPHADLARQHGLHGRPQHEQQNAAQQHTHGQQAPAARAAEGFDEAQHDGREGGAYEDDALDEELLDPVHVRLLVCWRFKRP